MQFNNPKLTNKNNFLWVPGASSFNPLRIFSSKNNFFNDHFFYSFQRHALIDYLKFQEHRTHKKPLLLMPNFMCHEVYNALDEAEIAYQDFMIADDFTFTPSSLEEVLTKDDRGQSYLLLPYLYGKMLKNINDIVQFCERHHIEIIEDFAHVPYDHQRPFAPVALYSFRKLYSLPYGASIRFNDKSLAEEFTKWKKNRISFYDSAVNAIKWAIREIIKKVIIILGIKKIRSYQDLSLDPLQKHNELLPLIKSYALRLKKNISEKRTSNYQHYQKRSHRLPNWLKPFKYERDDAPYGFICFVDDNINQEEFLSHCLRSGVSVVKGLALPEATQKPIPKHLRNIIKFPLNEELNEKQIEHVYQVIENYQ